MLSLLHFVDKYIDLVFSIALHDQDGGCGLLNGLTPPRNAYELCRSLFIKKDLLVQATLVISTPDNSIPSLISK